MERSIYVSIKPKIQRSKIYRSLLIHLYSRPSLYIFHRPSATARDYKRQCSRSRINMKVSRSLPLAMLPTISWHNTQLVTFRRQKITKYNSVPSDNLFSLVGRACKLIWLFGSTWGSFMFFPEQNSIPQ